jgi:hypothetical protein
MLGLVAPLLAVVALSISLQSLETSQQSMKVGQRAYLSLTDGTFEVLGVNRSVVNDDASVRFSFTIHNLGNTPATILGVTAHCKNIERREAIDSSGPLGSRRQYILLDYITAAEPLHELGSKSNTAVSKSFTFPKLLVPTPLEKWQGLYLRGQIEYLDVFHELHTVKWCWVQEEAKYPSECSPEVAADPGGWLQLYEPTH